MEKIYGAKERQDGLYSIGRNKWELFYGFGKDNPEDETGYNWRQQFRTKPTADECNAVIKKAINDETDRRILEDFVWKGMAVWLSSENQFNYKAAYDLAVQTNGATLPVRFKFGSEEAPAYHTFATLEEFGDFYTSAMAHINTALNEGWQEKDAVDNMNFERDE